MELTYRPLGTFIREVDVRNTGLKITKLMGVNLNKEMMPSVANVIGTDLSNYKIVRKNQFACKLMSVGRDACLPIALKSDDEPVIISSAYYAFEVINSNEILPEYLMLCFLRPIFDKELWFKTGGDVRGGITWNDFCQTKIPYVNINMQKKLINYYAIIKNRISLLKKINSKIWDVLLLNYKSFAKKSSIVTKLGEICSFQEGYVNPPQTEPENFNGDVNWLRAGDVNESCIYNTERTLTHQGFKSAGKSAILFQPGTIMITKSGVIGRLGLLEIAACGNRAVINISVNKSKDIEWVYLYLKSNQMSISELATGSAQRNLYVPILQNLDIPVLKEEESLCFHCKFEPLFTNIKRNCKEIEELKEMIKIIFEMFIFKEAV